MMAATGTRRAKFSRPSHRLGQAATRQAQSHARQQAPRPDRPRCRLGQALGRHINHWGQGHEAVLRYLARYVFRVTITNTRIVALDDPPSLSATSSANHRAGAPAVCTATSSIAASSSMFCPKAFTRSDILAWHQPPTRSSFFPCSVNLQPTFIAERGAD